MSFPGAWRGGVLPSAWHRKSSRGWAPSRRLRPVSPDVRTHTLGWKKEIRQRKGMAGSGSTSPLSLSLAPGKVFWPENSILFGRLRSGF